MNDPDFQIDRILRESPPEPLPVPGLESRICRTVRQSGRQRVSPLVPAIVGIIFAAPMLVLGIFALLPETAPSDPVAKHAPPPVEVTPATRIEARNPLRTEARAIGNDAKRASRFLLDTLPSLAER